MSGFDPAALDEASRPAWPALRSVAIDGWEARISGGYTGRANSTTPVGNGVLSIDERIARVEAAYADAAQPALFRIPDFTDEAVTRALDAQGYAPLFRHSIVLTSHDPARGDDTSVHITDAPDATWLDVHAQADDVPAAQRAMHDALFQRTPTPRRFAAALDGSRTVAVAMAVLAGDIAIVQGVGTHPAARRAGHARRVMRALLADAWRRGARATMLQVGASNEAAQAMYASLGYDEAYRYAYRKRG